MENAPEIKKKIKKEILNGIETEVAYREMSKPASAEELAAMREKYKEARHGNMMQFCPPFNPRSYIAHEEGRIICEQDVPVKLRDGVTIYTDIYRPEGATNIPVIISWSFFGKRPGDGMDDWKIMGVPANTISKMAKFESADPGYWCRCGYAIANVDPRGIGHSEGDLSLFGTQDGRDGYDFCEWVAQQHWCNGRVGFFGNSCVAMTQYRIAAEQPPHLCAIAPWEATTDMYRESVYEGGIPAKSFPTHIVTKATGHGYIDDMVENMERYPFMGPYWEDKIPRFDKIRVPAYCTASWSHFHLRGSMMGFRKMRSQRKWLRVHREFEWPDTYCNKYLEELRVFFDRYLKNINNGWELTPKIRIEVMDAFDHDYQINRSENEFPLARTQYKKLYLDAANGSLSQEACATEAKVSYDSQTGLTTFDMAFDEETELTGYFKLRLWVEADGHDDMDLFINVQKLSTKGEWLPTSVLGEPHPGAWGKMRVSRRKLDEKLSTDYQPVQAHTVDEKLQPGEIVPVDIEINPTSKIWHKGQQIRVQIAGRYIREGWFEPIGWIPDNKGNHIIHAGGKYDSYLQIPVIPPKYQDGDYIYR